MDEIKEVIEPEAQNEPTVAVRVGRVIQASLMYYRQYWQDILKEPYDPSDSTQLDRMKNAKANIREATMALEEMFEKG